ncbi:serine/threonine-protein kinase [Microbacterium testaceum]|uniref:serine/threonine-protein kinase n=1 Tax=Microbacterium testaceum TaxID=2033 RepID=UPI00177CF905|nr:serine/threonine-protein kinase [Microbacterium testaceum]
MSHAPDHSMPHAGDILGGRYILRERIGAGGMGRVFRARDEVLARDVAIKIFFADATDEPEPIRRMSEARALAALDHPSLVTLYDARLTGDDHVYLVMELVNGPSLQRRIEEGPLSSAEVAGIVTDLAGALAVVHDAGIVHRDIKPSNVLLRPVRGGARAVEAVLADFGVARLIGATRLTTPGTVIGTAAYLAPEQVRGEAPRAESDVYALGLLAIEALTRLHPFGQGTLQETLLARLARQPEVPDDFGGEWQSLLTAMTAFDPDDRPTAASVVERAESLAREAAVTAEGAPEAPASWMLPTALMAAPPAPAVPSAAAPATARVALVGDTAPVAAASSVGVGAGSSFVPTERTRRAPRRRWLWFGLAASMALIVGGHVMAFSLSAVPDMTTDRVSTPAPSGAPSSTPAPLVAENAPSKVEPVSSTDAGTPTPSQPPATPQPVQPAPAQPVAEVPGGGVSQTSPGGGGAAVVEPAPSATAPGTGGAAVPTPGASSTPEATPGGAVPAPGPGKGAGNGNGNGKGSSNGKGPGAGHNGDAAAG